MCQPSARVKQDGGKSECSAPAFRLLREVRPTQQIESESQNMHRRDLAIGKRDSMASRMSISDGQNANWNSASNTSQTVCSVSSGWRCALA